MKSLKEVYGDLFKIGAAVAPVNERMSNREIGNAQKEAVLTKHFNSITFENLLKPMYNMAYWSEDAREDYLPFEFNPEAKKMMDWCKENGMSVRGHVLVWHSQCPDEIFCKGYKAVRLENPDGAPFPRRLNPECLVDRDTLLKRLQSYIDSLMKYMFSNGYANVIYAWDVVNEAIEPMDKLPDGMRDTNWYKIIGSDLIYWAFKFAKEASEKYAKEYVSLYSGVEDYKAIMPSLFYNDYCEWMSDRKESIICALKREENDHGSILSEDLIDGIGLQAHLSDTNDLDEYFEALYEYGALGKQLHLTELDVKCTCTNQNADYYQAVFYKRLFEGLIKAKKSGINITAVVFWGLTDDTSWIPKANPLLFNGDLSKKLAFDAIVYALEGGSLGEPMPIDASLAEKGVYSNFDDNCDFAYFRGAGHLARIFTTDKEKHSGTKSLLVTRYAKDASVRFDISAFIGRKAKISFYILTADKLVKSGIDGSPAEELVSVSTKDGWNLVEYEAKISKDVISAQFYVETDGAADMFIDDIEVELA